MIKLQHKMHVMNFLHLKLEFSFLTTIYIKYAESMEICKGLQSSLEGSAPRQRFFKKKKINNILVNILRASNNLMFGKQDNKRQ